MTLHRETMAAVLDARRQLEHLLDGLPSQSTIALAKDRISTLITAVQKYEANRLQACACYPSPFEHEDECPRGYYASVPPPHFERGATFHDGVTYNHHRDYTDASRTLWRCTGRTDDTPLWARSSAEMGLEISVLVERHGPLAIVPDAFFDASDDELSELVSQALSNPR